MHILKSKEIKIPRGVCLDKLTFTNNGIKHPLMFLFLNGFPNNLAYCGGTVSNIKRVDDRFEADIEILDTNAGRFFSGFIEQNLPFHISAYGFVDNDGNAEVRAFEFQKR